MDHDHELLLALAAAVERLIVEDAPAAEIHQKFVELAVYSIAHFDREEAHMRACRFPGLGPHKREHAELAGWFHHIAAAMAEGGTEATKTANEQTLAFLEAWIHRHLMGFDKALAIYSVSRADADRLQNEWAFRTIQPQHTLP